MTGFIRSDSITTGYKLHDNNIISFCQQILSLDSFPQDLNNQNIKKCVYCKHERTPAEIKQFEQMNISHFVYFCSKCGLTVDWHGVWLGSVSGVRNLLNVQLVEIYKTIQKLNEAEKKYGNEGIYDLHGELVGC